MYCYMFIKQVWNISLSTTDIAVLHRRACARFVKGFQILLSRVNSVFPNLYCCRRKYPKSINGLLSHARCIFPGLSSDCVDGTSIIYAHQNTAGNFLVYTRACLCTLYFVEVIFINRFLTLKGFTCEILSRTSNDNLCDETGFSRIKSNDAVLCTTVFTLVDPEFFSPFPFERQIDSHCFFTRRPCVYKTKQHRTIDSFTLFFVSSLSLWLL